ncbi:MAG: zeta toxin family protein [Streptococcaceae bacterium]|nr:zeta toxin family protein [Streptococcaceae bacterium]
MKDKSLAALEYAKAHKDEFLSELVKNKKIAKNKVALFMAGSPGAGKTEVAVSLAEMYSDYVVIDADAFRAEFPEYDGSNSALFQKASSWLVEQAFKFVISEGFSFILDATFALESSNSNIRRAVKNAYQPTIFYVYQNPYVAWKFTKEREKVEGRAVPQPTFINAYLKSRENIVRAKATFSEVQLNVVIKDFDNNISNVQYDADNIELIIPEMYSKQELEEKLND